MIAFGLFVLRELGWISLIFVYDGNGDYLAGTCVFLDQDGRDFHSGRPFPE